MGDCNCTACRDTARGIAVWSLCFRETEEAIANRARRDEMARIVSRWRWVRPIDRLLDKSRKALPLNEILKDHYGPSYEPYERDCLFRERARYEWRRERVTGRIARTRHEIAEAYGYTRRIDRLYELVYREHPLLDMRR